MTIKLMGLVFSDKKSDFSVMLTKHIQSEILDNNQCVGSGEPVEQPVARNKIHESKRKWSWRKFPLNVGSRLNPKWE